MAAPLTELSEELQKTAKEAKQAFPKASLELQEKIRKASLVFGDAPLPDDVCFTIQDSEIGSLGNISAIIGKAKSRKTFLVSAFVASALTGECLGIEASKLKGKDVLWFDTEQGKTHSYNCLSRTIAMSDLQTHPVNFSMLCLRRFTPKERIEIIEHSILSNENIGLVIIDGIRDLVRDINNAEESTEIIGKLMKWSEDKHCHILTVLHQNKGNDYARGHLGTELVNKAESVLSVEKDQDISIVKSNSTRSIDFEPFAFNIDAVNIPHLYDDYLIKGNSSGRPTTPKTNHKDKLNQVFENDEQLSYTMLKMKIISVFGVAESTAKSKVSSFVKDNLIEKTPKGNYKLPNE